MEKVLNSLKNTIKNIVKEYGLLFVLLSFACLILFSFYIFGNNPFRWGLSNDHVFQINQFYSEAYRLLEAATRTKSFPFYSWNTFLGNSFYASKLYYLSGDIFLPFLLIFKTNACGFLLFEAIMCIFISAIGMMKYLKIIGVKNHYYRIIFSLVFAIGGCSISKLCYPMWHRFYSFMPFLFYGVERYLKDKKLAVFAISVTILFLQNYYFMFPLTMFLPFYFIYRSYILDKERGFHLLKYLKDAIKLIIAYIIGCLAGMVLLLPGIIFVLNSTRLTYNELEGVFTWPYKTWLSLYYYVLLPITTIFQNNPFAISLKTENPSVAYDYSITIASIGVLGLISFFRIKDLDKKLAHIIMLLFLLLTNMILPICSLMHFNTTPTLRFTIIIGFMFLVFAAKGLDLVNDKKELRKSLIIYLLITVVIVTLSLLTKDLSFNNCPALYILVGASSLLIVLEVLLFNKKLLLLLLVFVELVAYGTYSLTHYGVSDYGGDLTANEFEYNKYQDEDKMYRIVINYVDVPPYWSSPLNLNASLIYGYSNLSTYDTTYEYVLDEFLEWTNSDFANNILNITNPHVFRLLGVKYVGASDCVELDSVNEYEYAYNIQRIRMYKLDNYYSFGHTFSNFVNKNDIEIDVNTFDWDNTLIINDDLLSEINDIESSEKVQFEVMGQINNNNFYGEITVDQKQVLFFSLPFDEGWTIVDNGNKVTTYNVDGGFTAIVLEPGYHFIDAWYQPKGFKTGFVLTCIGSVGILALIVLDLRKKKIQK